MQIDNFMVKNFTAANKISDESTDKFLPARQTSRWWC